MEWSRKAKPLDKSKNTDSGIEPSTVGTRHTNRQATFDAVCLLQAMFFRCSFHIYIYIYTSWITLLTCMLNELLRIYLLCFLFRIFPVNPWHGYFTATWVITCSLITTCFCNWKSILAKTIDRIYGFWVKWLKIDNEKICLITLLLYVLKLAFMDRIY